jgi:hypothetical protein
MRDLVSSDSIFRSHGAGPGQSQLRRCLALCKPFVHCLGQFGNFYLGSAICIRVQSDLVAVPRAPSLAPGSRLFRVSQNSRSAYAVVIKPGVQSTISIVVVIKNTIGYSTYPGRGSRQFACPDRIDPQIQKYTHVVPLSRFCLRVTEDFFQNRRPLQGTCRVYRIMAAVLVVQVKFRGLANDAFCDTIGGS